MSPKPLRGVGSGRFLRPERLTAPRRKTARLVRQDWPVPATYLATFRPTALISPAGRCGGFSRRAVCPSKPLKTRRRYPRRAGGFCAIEYARTVSGQPSRTARAAAQTERPEHPEPDNAAVAIFLFRTTEIRDVQRSFPCKETRTPAPVLGDSPSCARSR